MLTKSQKSSFEEINEINQPLLFWRKISGRKQNIWNKGWIGDKGLEVTGEINANDICAIYCKKFLGSGWKWLFSREIHGFKSRFKEKKF